MTTLKTPNYRAGYAAATGLKLRLSVNKCLLLSKGNHNNLRLIRTPHF